MFYYCFLAMVAGLVAGIILAARTKKAESVVYGTLDKVGKVTNILLIPAYVALSIFGLAVVMLGYFPEGEGILAVAAWAFAFIGATGPALCGLGLGASVALRKKGRSKLSFAIQFAGVIGVGITVLLLMIFDGNLFGSLN